MYLCIICVHHTFYNSYNHTQKRRLLLENNLSRANILLKLTVCVNLNLIYTKYPSNNQAPW